MFMNRKRLLLQSLAVCLVCLPGPMALMAVDHVVTVRDGRQRHISGKIVTQAVDGGLLMIDREGVLWAIQPDELIRSAQDEVPYQPLQAEELAQRLLERMPAGSRVHTTAHYVICHNTSPAYATWCGALYERLFLAFRNYWQRRGLEMVEPEMPLVALVFDGPRAYEQYARGELGDAAPAIDAYYSLQSNRIAMYDLTGTRGLQNGRQQLTTSAQINNLLMRPEAYRMVATIVHEATHQLAYNCGLHTRMADIPQWISEGLAVYFETPDLRSSRGWRNIGGVHHHRLGQFRQYLADRPPDSLTTLIQDNTRFVSLKTATDAYAEAWALNYYLIRNHSEAYTRYMQRLAAKPPVVYDTPEERLGEFKAFFGSDLETLDREFLRYMQSVR
jgi:hypothetical protein